MIQEKLLKLQEQWIALKKDASNPFFKSKYITLDNIIDTYNSLLTKEKIVCYHHTKDNKLITTLFDVEDKTFVESEFNIYTNDPQKQGSEITYWKRYNLWQLLNIQTDEDDDWNKASSWGNTKEYYSDKRDLLAIINDLKASKDKESIIAFKEEWKLIAKTEKQQEWLKKEYETAINKLNNE